MNKKALIAISLVTAPTLLVACGLPEDGDSRLTQAPDETYVERAVRTRLDADGSRFEAEETDETILERAVRTRASELVQRVDAELYVEQ